MNYGNTSFKLRDPDKQRKQRARAQERAKQREAIANYWGLSTRRMPAREIARWLSRRERLCCHSITSLAAGGGEAAIVAAFAFLAVNELRAIIRRLYEEFGGEYTIWFCGVSEDDEARIAYALHLYQPAEDHWRTAQAKLALTTWGPTLDAHPAAELLRNVAKFDRGQALPCDQTVPALCEALQYHFRFDHGWRRPEFRPAREIEQRGRGR